LAKISQSYSQKYTATFFCGSLCTSLFRTLNYSNNYEIFIISDYISVYADHAIDK